MSGVDGRNLLARWLEGDLDPDETARLYALLERDAVLRSEGSAQVRYAALLAALLRPEADTASADTIMRLLTAQRESRMVRTVSAVDGRLRWRRRRPLLVAAAGLAVAAILAVVVIPQVISRQAPSSVLVVVESLHGEAVDTHGVRRPLTPGAVVGPGERIEAAGEADAAFLRLTHRGASISLAGGARVVIPLQAEGGDLHLQIEAGLVACDGTALTAAGHHLRLTSPQAVVLTEGTRFDCEVADGRTQVRLAEGAVRVVAAGVAVRLVPGEMTRVTAGGAPGPPSVTERNDIWDGLRPWQRPLRAAEATPPWRYRLGLPGITRHGDLQAGDAHGPRLRSILAQGDAGFTPDQYAAVGASTTAGVMLRLVPGAALHFRVRTETGGRILVTIARPRQQAGTKPEWASSPDCHPAPGEWQEFTLPLSEFWSWKPGHDWGREAVNGIAFWGFGTGRFQVEDIRVE